MECKSLYLVLEGEATRKASVILNVVSSPSLQITLPLRCLRSSHFANKLGGRVHQLHFVCLVTKLTRLSNLVMVLSGCSLDSS